MFHLTRALCVLVIFGLCAFPALAADTPTTDPVETPVVETAATETVATEAAATQTPAPDALETTESQELEFLAKTIKLPPYCYANQPCVDRYDCGHAHPDGWVSYGVCKPWGCICP